MIHPIFSSKDGQQGVLKKSKTSLHTEESKPSIARLHYTVLVEVTHTPLKLRLKTPA